MQRLEIKLAQPVLSSKLKSIHVEFRDDIDRPIGTMYELFCKDYLGRERGAIYCYDTYDDARKAAFRLWNHLASYYQ